MTAQSDCTKSAQSTPKVRTQPAHTMCPPVKGDTVCTERVHFVRFQIEEKPSSNGWRNLKVVVPFQSKRRTHLSYWLAWNGQRWARSGELRRICDWYPEIAEELTALLETPNGH
jgi:hypothetical protein